MNKHINHKPLEKSDLTTKHIGIAADHGGFELKKYLVKMLREANYEVTDFGDHQLKLDDDYPDLSFHWLERLPLGRCIAASASVGVA
jgi:ribose 5-phosphate isomerase B